MERGEGFSRSEILRLEGWMTFPEIGELFGVSKQMVHTWVFTTEIFDLRKEVRKIGERPIYVVKEEAVLRYKEGKNA